ncbi:hypothetical protein M4578_21995 [Salipiger sp. P9]|uniref:hypothetical protein n=1 Tax=Salipiger pentaromativorans TaxID=2943193 RepID=UPI0021589E41|nr:hypothetical protein [Salipiger pentaromativorans]MCR8550503.1 hypothetical protein [Salipiger pentaromativorans]
MSETTHARATQLIDRLARLLRDEIAAIGQGQLARVEELFPRKQELLAEIETAFADAEHLFTEESAAAEKLRRKLSDLRDLIQTDLSMLRRMTDATSAVAREIDRIRDRQSLSGLYERDGSQPQKSVSSPQRFDQSV